PSRARCEPVLEKRASGGRWYCRSICRKPACPQSHGGLRPGATVRQAESRATTAAGDRPDSANQTADQAGTESADVASPSTDQASSGSILRTPQQSPRASWAAPAAPPAWFQ